MIILSSGTDMNINGESGLTMTITNAGSHIAGSALLGVFSSGNFNAGAVNLLVNNRDGGLIDDAASVLLSSGGSFTTAGDATFVISSRDDGGGSGIIGGDASLAVTSAGNMSIGGDLVGAFSMNAGGTVNNVFASVSTTGALSAGSIDLEIDNGGATLSGFRGGGMILGDANVSLVALNINSGGALSTFIANLDGGSIGGDALVQLVASGSINAGGPFLAEIFNNSFLGGSGGTIGGDATVTIAAQSLSVASLAARIDNGAGTIGGSALLDMVLGGGLTVTADATFEILNQVVGLQFGEGGIGGGTVGGDATINFAAASLTAGSLTAIIDNTFGAVGGASSINFATTNALTVTGDATFQILRENLETTNSITISAGSINVGGSLVAGILDGTNRVLFGDVSLSSVGDIFVGQDLQVDGTIAAGGDLTVGGTLSLPSLATAGGSITAGGVFGAELSAGTDITFVQSGGGQPAVFVDILTAGGNINLMNVAQVQNDSASSDGSINFTPNDFVLTASAIVSTGPTFPLLVSNGFAPDPNFGNNNPGNGGHITLNLTGGGLTIGSANDLTGIEANGGGFALDSTAGGNGGTVDIIATGDVTLLDGDITATSGAIPSGALPGGSFILGNGGTVNITTAGAITVNSNIEVSSLDNETIPIRRSAKGGNISLTSSKASGAAINVSNSGQLLALLDQAAPGPGGKITILATGGGGSNVTVNGNVQATRGTVDIRHTGANGVVNLGDATNFVILHGDIVKAGALGNNGLLTVGQGLLTADDTLKLYGASANGEVRFVDSVSIGGTNFTIIAANTVTIIDGKTVNVNGARADVYTGFNGTVPNANYTGSGGNGSTTGVFSGAGANNPQPIGNAPPFDGPPGG